MKRVLNVEAIRELASKVESWRSLRLACGLSNTNNLRKVCKRHNIDTSHFFAQPAIKPTKDLTEYLIKGRAVSSSYLKQRLLKAGVKKSVCETCHRTEWEGSPIPLDLHHVDGDRLNNLLENIQLLCCNCHALTPNYCGANAKRNPTRRSPEEYRDAIVSSTSAKEACIKLGINPAGGNITTIKLRAARYGLSFVTIPSIEIQPTLMDDLWMDKPRPKGRKRDQNRLIRNPRPPLISKEDLSRLMWEMSIEKVGKLYGVSDNAIRRWACKHELSLPPPGYWIRRNSGYTHEESLVTQKKVKNPLRRPTEEQAHLAFKHIQEGASFRAAGREIGFDHETTKSALARFGLVPAKFMIGKTRHGGPTLKRIWDHK